MSVIPFPRMQRMTTQEETDTTNIKQHIIKETAVSFSSKVEELVWEKDITYFEAVQIQMELSNYEPEHVAKLITLDLHTKLSEEAEKLSLIKKTTNRLDL